MTKKHPVLCLAILGLCATPAAAKDRMTVNPDAVNTETILHTWSWNFPEIARSMKEIKDAGFTMIQTSPVQRSYAPEGSGKKLFDEKVAEGNWYYYYQPTDWKVGNAYLGSRDQMKQMMDSAAKYGIKVIVDVLPNHTAFDTDAVAEEFYKAVGGREKMFHSNGLSPISNYQDRTQCTLQGVGGLPDVNTENPDFQKYYMEFVNDLLSLGVRGFRYDTAKHIGVHSDPVDKAAGVKENDFWDVATGRKAVKGVRLALPEDSLCIYGEVLQDKNVKEKEYEEYIDQTASAYGHELRQALENGKADIAALSDWHHPADPSHLVTWVESHDTYANAHESAHLTDDMVRQGWVWLTAREKGTPLFFSRPAGRTPEKYWGNNRIGARGNDEFFHPEVVAANKFRRGMAGQPEQIGTLDDGTVLYVARGSKGLALINISQKPQKIKMETALPDGTYTDSVHGLTFKVKKGVLTGKLTPTSSALIF